MYPSTTIQKQTNRTLKSGEKGNQISQPLLFERWNSICWSTGHFNKAIYAFFPPSTYSEDAGLFLSMDDGQSWQPCKAANLDGDVLQIAAHPHQSNLVLLVTSKGLYFSDDSGENFTPLDLDCDQLHSAHFDSMDPTIILYTDPKPRIHDLSADKAKNDAVLPIIKRILATNGLLLLFVLTYLWLR